MRNKTILFIFLFLFSITFVSSAVLTIGDYTLPIKKGDCFNIPLGCDNCTWANLTITHQNGTILVSNAEMTSEDGFHYNYTFCDTNDLGQYWITFHYDDDGIYLETERDWFEVTSTGKHFDSGQSISSLGILFGALGVAFLFMFLGFKISANSKMIPISFIFIVLSIILIIYSLFLGWTIGSDIIEHEAFSGTSEIIFTSVLWLMVAVVLISTIFFFVAFIKELGNSKKIDRFGEGFNPLTDTYDY